MNRHVTLPPIKPNKEMDLETKEEDEGFDDDDVRFDDDDDDYDVRFDDEDVRPDDDDDDVSDVVRFEDDDDDVRLKLNEIKINQLENTISRKMRTKRIYVIKVTASSDFLIAPCNMSDHLWTP